MKRQVINLVAVFLLVILIQPITSVAWTHVARPGETLNSLATFYYGSSKYSMVIRAANGFMHPDDGSLIQGERVEVPGIIYHRVETGEDWYSLANQYLGSSKRGKFLAELNGLAVESTLASGKIVKIPYQLLYILAPEESLKSVAKMFLGEDFSSNWLRGYNLKKKKKYNRGDALLVPLINVEYTEAAKKIIESKESEKFSEDDRKAQLNAVADITRLRDAFTHGRYVEIIATSHKLLGTNKLTNPQQIGVYKYLAFAYIAFGEIELAKEAFKSALKLQPSMELSPITTSPKILTIFQEVQQKVVQEAAEEKK